MSLFQARDWWSTYAGNDEEFDNGCLCISNIDNSPQGQGKTFLVVVNFFDLERIKVTDS